MPKEAGHGVDSIVEDEEEAKERDFPSEDEEEEDENSPNEKPKDNAPEAGPSPAPAPAPAPNSEANGSQQVNGIKGSKDENPVEASAPPNDEEPADFDNPCLNPQRTVWIPEDSLGLAREEEKSLLELNIKTSLEGAAMDIKGHIEVTTPPPDEDEE